MTLGHEGQGAPTEGATSWRYVAGCCMALALAGCPQLLGDDFLLGREVLASDAGSETAGAAGRGAAGAAGASAAGGTGGVEELPDASSAGQGGSGALDPTCNDGLRNQDETGVDCGGSACSPCNCVFGPFQDVVQVEGLGSDDRYGPMLSSDGTSLYYSVLATGDEDIYRAVRSSGTGTTFTDFRALANVNAGSLEGSPFISRDNLTLLFFSDRAPSVGSRDLWMATRGSAAQDFSAAAPMPGVNSAAMDLLPRLSYDGLTLYFQSTRSGGSGNSDIWAAERPSPTGSFGVPRPRGDVNTAGREEGFSLSGDQLTIVLSSNRAGGSGGMDLWMATRSDPHGTFGPAVALGELNGTADELDPGLSLNGREIFFTTTRDGDHRIYHAVRDCQ